jgi:adenylate kinase
MVEIEVDDEEIVHRLTGRRVHPGSGRVYHIDYNPPKIPGLDDVTGEPLIQRSDDSEETIRKRLKIYHDDTQPLIEFYKEMRRTNPSQAPHYDHVLGIGTIDEIFNRITDKMGESTLI